MMRFGLFVAGAAMAAVAGGATRAGLLSPRPAAPPADPRERGTPAACPAAELDFIRSPDPAARPPRGPGSGRPLGQFQPRSEGSRAMNYSVSYAEPARSVTADATADRLGNTVVIALLLLLVATA
jgi:hypothetical protein